MLARPEVESDLSTEDLSLLVQLTEGYSGSDLADLCRTAALAPVRELMQQQRQQLGLNRKRRRLGSGLGLACGFAQSSRQSEESYAAAGSPVDSTGCTDGQASAQQLVTVAGCAGSGGAEQVPVGHAAEAQLRALVLADFKVALELVKPAAADAETSAMA
jgi:SpoVK/Ycf46/Vps4 family AAA+-type ATPase